MDQPLHTRLGNIFVVEEPEGYACYSKQEEGSDSEYSNTQVRLLCWPGDQRKDWDESGILRQSGELASRVTSMAHHSLIPKTLSSSSFVIVH